VERKASFAPDEGDAARHDLQKCTQAYAAAVPRAGKTQMGRLWQLLVPEPFLQAALTFCGSVHRSRPRISTIRCPWAIQSLPPSFEHFGSRSRLVHRIHQCIKLAKALTDAMHYLNFYSSAVALAEVHSGVRPGVRIASASAMSSYHSDTPTRRNMRPVKSQVACMRGIKIPAHWVSATFDLEATC
jgi:hypothetical protein